MSARRDWDNPRGYGRRPITDPQTLEIYARDISIRFHQLMDDAMLVSGFKYGAVEDAYPERVNAMESLELRLQKYAETGNVEYLVDVANFAMIEFMCPNHPRAFFKATDAGGSPGRKFQHDVYEGKPSQLKNTDVLDKDEEI